jgi:group I intron endonuclease
MKTGTIYKITNTVTGMSYIGQTICDVSEKLNLHLSNSYKEKYKNKFVQALRMYNKECFVTEVIEDNVPIDQLNYLEKQYIKIFDTVNSGYNTTTGGPGSPGNKHSKESRLMISKKHSGKKLSNKTKKLIGLAAKQMWDNRKEQIGE